MRAPRRPRSTRLMRSRCSSGGARPAPSPTPSPSISTTSSKSSRVEVAVGPGAAHEVEEAVLGPVLAGALGDDLLRQDVERRPGCTTRSRRPARTARTSAAHSTSSSRVVGKRRPCGPQPEGVAGAADALQEGRDAARRADLADEVDAADVDAQLQRGGGRPAPRSSPPLSRCSTRRRRSRERLPWWLATASSPRRSPRWWATRSESRRVLTKTSVVRWARDRARRGGRRSSPHCSPAATASRSVGGTSIGRSRSRWWPRSTIARQRARGAIERAGADRGSARSPRSAAASPRARCAAAARRGRRVDIATTWSRRASDSARWLPRLSRARAWISSTITVRTWRSVSRLRAAVSIRYSDSGVVIRMCGGVATHRLARSLRGVSPVRTPVADRRQRQAQLGGDLGDLRQRRLEVALDVVAERLQRRDVDDRGLVGRASPRLRSLEQARRCPRGTPRASCRSRWARR